MSEEKKRGITLFGNRTLSDVQRFPVPKTADEEITRSDRGEIMLRMFVFLLGAADEGVRDLKHVEQLREALHLQTRRAFLRSSFVSLLPP